MSTSLCVIHHPPGRVELRECGLSPIRPGQYLVETQFSAVSPGTEGRALRGKQVGVGPEPYVPGYQGVGTVLEAGDHCELAPGDTVFFGGGGGFTGGISASWGSHAQRLIVDESKIFKLPAGIDRAEASLSKLIAIALHGIKLSELKSGETVAVIGLGILGQFSARLARLFGGEVTAFDRVPRRVELAQKAGIKSHIVEDSIGETVARSLGADSRFDVIIDVTGSSSVLTEGIALAHDLSPWEAPRVPSTRYVVQGSFAGEVRLDYQQVFMKELRLFFPRDQYSADLLDVFGLLASRELKISDVTGEPLSPHAAPTCYQTLSGPHPDRLTAIFDWSLV
jgi:2-desacetyl-2-hydroxyethyl bacteriochlorophyllide A dehydrogenase